MSYLKSLLTDNGFKGLCSHYGGTTYNVPCNEESPRFQKLVDAIGLQDAKKLVNMEGSCTIYVPYLQGALYRRVHLIKKMHDDGMSIRQISKSFEYVGRYTERRIQSLLSSNNIGINQLELEYG